MNLIPINRPLAFSSPNLQAFRPPIEDERRSDFSDKDIADAMAEFFQQRALQATVPTVEEIRQYQQQQPPEAQPVEQTAATDQFVYGDDNAIPPPQPQTGLAGTVQPPVEDPLYAQGYRYRFNGEPMYNAPSQDAINMAQAQARADYYGGRGDTAREMSNRALYERSKAQLIQDTFIKAQQAGDLEAALKLRNDIPDNLTYKMEQVGDTDQYAIYMTPSGKPDATKQLVRQGTKKDLEAFVLQDISPEMAQQAAKLYADQKYQQEGRALAWSQEARQLRSEQQNAISARRQALTQNLALIEKQLDPNSGVFLNQDQYLQLRGQQDAIREELLKLGPMGSPGAYGPDGATPAWMINSETGGDWGAQNDAMGAGGKRGHFGRIQFGQARLQEAQQALGVKFTPAQFMADENLQRQVEAWHIADIGQFIQDNGWDTSGKLKIQGTPMTPGAMLGVAHLGGKGGLQKYIETNGAYNPADVNGTRLADYALRGYQSDLQQSPANNQGASPVNAALAQQGIGRQAAPTIAPPNLANPKAKQYQEEYAARMQNPPVDKATQQKAVTSYFKQLNAINQDPKLSDDVKTRMVHQLDATMAPYLPSNFLTAKGAKGTPAAGPSDKLKGFAEPDQAKAGEQGKAEKPAKKEPLTLEERVAQEQAKWEAEQAAKGKVKEAKERAMKQATEEASLHKRFTPIWQNREQIRRDPAKKEEALAELKALDAALPPKHTMRDMLVRAYQYLNEQGDWKRYRDPRFENATPTLPWIEDSPRLPWFR